MHTDDDEKGSTSTHHPIQSNCTRPFACPRRLCDTKPSRDCCCRENSRFGPLDGGTLSDSLGRLAAVGASRFTASKSFRDPCQDKKDPLFELLTPELDVLRGLSTRPVQRVGHVEGMMVAGWLGEVLGDLSCPSVRMSSSDRARTSVWQSRAQISRP